MFRATSTRDTTVFSINNNWRSVAGVWSNLYCANMNAKAVHVKRVAEIRDGSHSIDCSRGRPVAVDMGAEKLLQKGEEQENKTLITNGASRKKHAGSKKKKEWRDTPDDNKNQRRKEKKNGKKRGSKGINL